MQRPVSMMLASLLAIGAAGAARAQAADCRSQLTGDWRGAGTVEAFGARMEVDNHYVLKADGGFEAIQRYRGRDGEWQEQRSAGQWSARPGSAAQVCDVTMTTSGEWGSATTTTSYLLKGPGRFRFAEAAFDMVRSER